MTIKRIELKDFRSLKSAQHVYLYELNTYTMLLCEFLLEAGINVAGFVQEHHTSKTLAANNLPILSFSEYANIWHPDDAPILYSDNLVINKYNPYHYMGVMGITEYLDPIQIMAPFKEADEWFYIASALRHFGDPKEGVLYDIGANRGGATHIALEHYKNIVGIEANPAMQSFYKKEFAAHDHVHLVPYAVGSEDQTGTQKFYLDVSEHAGGSSLHAEYTKRHIVDDIDEIDVTVKTLSQICRAEELYPSFIKVDVEGSEPEVLLSSMDVIRAHTPIILFECWSDSWDKGVRDLCLALKEAGYKIYCNIAGGEIWDFFEYGYALDYVTNAICLPQDKQLPKLSWDNDKILPMLSFQ